MTAPKEQLTERQEHVLLTLYHRGRPGRWPGKQTLQALAGYLTADVDSGKMELTEHGHAYCRAVLDGEEPPPPPASSTAEEQGEPEVVAELDRYHDVHRRWPTIAQLAAFRGQHAPCLRRQIRLALGSGVIQEAREKGPRGGRCYRPVWQKACTLVRGDEGELYLEDGAGARIQVEDEREARQIALEDFGQDLVVVHAGEEAA